MIEGRIMALDVGDVRIGVAISDPLGITAQPSGVIQRKDESKDIAEIVRLVHEKQVRAIVVGLPLSADGSEGYQVHKTKDFVGKIKDVLDTEIIYQDERFTTAQARRELKTAGHSHRKMKPIIDQAAAQHILQTYLDRQSQKTLDNSE